MDGEYNSVDFVGDVYIISSAGHILMQHRYMTRYTGLYQLSCMIVLKSMFDYVRVLHPYQGYVSKYLLSL